MGENPETTEEPRGPVDTGWIKHDILRKRRDEDRDKPDDDKQPLH